MYDEIIALNNLRKYAYKDKDTLTYIMGNELQMRALVFMCDTDKTLKTAEESRREYIKHGYNNYAAGLLITPISLLLDRGDYKKAKEYLDIYEQESGLFDKEGNIEKGREYHYFNVSST